MIILLSLGSDQLKPSIINLKVANIYMSISITKYVAEATKKC